MNKKTCVYCGSVKVIPNTKIKKMEVRIIEKPYNCHNAKYRDGHLPVAIYECALTKQICCLSVRDEQTFPEWCPLPDAPKGMD